MVLTTIKCLFFSFTVFLIILQCSGWSQSDGGGDEAVGALGMMDTVGVMGEVSNGVERGREGEAAV